MKLIISISLLIIIASVISTASFAYGDCSNYGTYATLDPSTGGCKCMSGYVFGTNSLGKPYCMSGNVDCYYKHGSYSEYNSSSGLCECSTNYVLNIDSNKCVSQESVCIGKHGYNAKYNSTSKTCECRFGYVVSDGKCTDGNAVCRSKNGPLSSYNDSEKSCECPIGFILNSSNQCAIKQNNVYFTLEELDIFNKKAIIKSDYDSNYYLITYGSGCYDASFKKYLGKQIVVNLGTDYSVNILDKIILQNDNETCDIRSKEKVDSSTTLSEPKETENKITITNGTNKPIDNPIVETTKKGNVSSIISILVLMALGGGIGWITWKSIKENIK